MGIIKSVPRYVPLEKTKLLANHTMLSWFLTFPLGSISDQFPAAK